MLQNQRLEIFAQLLSDGRAVSYAYTAAGYRENSSNAARVAARPEVQARVSELNAQNAAARMVTVRRVLAELARIGFADITGAIDIKDGKALVRDLAEVPPDLRAAIAEIRQTRDGVALKFHSKPEALTLLGKHLQMWRDSLSVDVNINLHDLVQGSYRLERGELALPAPLELSAEPDEPEPPAPVSLTGELGKGSTGPSFP